MVECEIEYRERDTLFKGFVSYDEAGVGPRPAVMVLPDWGGRGPAACDKARQLAGLGYLGFAADMYGEARLGRDEVEKRALMTPMREDRGLLAARVLAAYGALSALDTVDSARIAAIGYCFGGLVVLDLARAGAEVRGVVSLHGLLTDRPEGMPEPEIRSKVLVLHGYDDPLVPPEQVVDFAGEMTRKRVDWQIHMYGMTTHSFSNPMAASPEAGMLYSATADRRSWQTTVDFLSEVLG